MSTLFLRKQDVLKLLDMKETIAAMEATFHDLAEGRAHMPPKIYLTVNKGDFRAMPAYIPGAAGLKWVNVHPDNLKKGLPTVMATLIYSDPETGYPLAMMDATDITAFRTGAVAAMASKYLAKKNPRSLGLIGAGRQAQAQLLAHAELLDLKLIKVYDLFPETAREFAKRFPKYPVEVRSPEDTVNVDILCTLTPSCEPIVRKEWVKPGTHINAVGADAPGKEELEPAVLNGARVVVDDMEQAVHSGEVNVPISKGLYDPKNIYARLADVVAGRKAGRASESEITIFVSTGLAVEDIALAKILYEKAMKSGGYTTLEFV